MSQSAAILFIVDGLGDRPHADLDGKTPLDAAHTPVMDQLAGSGSYGTVMPVPDGVAAHTHTGVGMLMGLDPAQLQQLSRGPVEAAGAGLDLKPGEVAMRMNFATVSDENEELMVLDRRAGRIMDGTKELAAALDNLDLGDGYKARVRSTDQHRGVVVLTGGELGAGITRTDPGNVELPVATRRSGCRQGNSDSARTAVLVNRFTRLAFEALDQHPVNQQRRRDGELPANGVLLRGAGAFHHFQHVPGKRGWNTTVVAGCRTVVGLARMLNLALAYRPSFTAGTDTDLDGKVSEAMAASENSDLVVVHFKAPDITAHDKQPGMKRDMLEKLDRAMNPLLDLPVAIALCADHGTDSNTGFHIDDPVPAFIAPAARETDSNPQGFSESLCLTGPLGQVGGSRFLELVMDSRTTPG